MPPSHNPLYNEFHELKVLFDKFLTAQIEKVNQAGQGSSLHKISTPKDGDLHNCFIAVLRKNYPNYNLSEFDIATSEIVSKNLWRFFVEYALRIYYSQVGKVFDEKLFLQLILAVIFTLVKVYGNCEVPKTATFNNFIHAMETNERMDFAELTEQINYLVGQIEARIA
jgi:hypothetical protein